MSLRSTLCDSGGSQLMSVNTCTKTAYTFSLFIKQATHKNLKPLNSET